MSLLSTLDADKLMEAAKKNLEPLLQQILSSGMSIEEKAVAQLHVESVAWQQVVSAQLTQFNATFAQLIAIIPTALDGYTVTISKKEK